MPHDVMPAPVLGPPPAPRVPVPARWTMPNGLRVVAAPREGMPQLVVRILLRAGSVFDPPALPGLASLCGSLLTEGTASFSPDALNARLDFLGAAFNANVGHDFVEVEALLLRETLVEGLSLLAEVVARPAFPETEVERVREEALDALVARLDEPANVADDRTNEETFGADHPYGMPSFGTPEGIEATTRADLAAFHAAHYLPGGSVLLAAGAFALEELREALDAAFGPWAGESPRAELPPVADAPARAGRVVVEPWEEASQSEIRMAGTGMERTHPDWIAGAVANYVLGGSTITGRLGANLREEKGWTYGARSTFASGVARGGWAAETAVDVAVTADAVREMRAEMQRMQDELVSADELRRAKDALVLSLPRAFETPSRIVGRLATIEAYGLPLDYWERFPAAVEAVTAEDVRRIARTYFDPARVVTVVVGGGIEGEA